METIKEYLSNRFKILCNKLDYVTSKEDAKNANLEYYYILNYDINFNHNYEGINILKISTINNHSALCFCFKSSLQMVSKETLSILIDSWINDIEKGNKLYFLN